MIPDTELRLLRDRLVQDAFAFDLIIPVTEGPKRYEKPKSFNLAEEIQLVQDAAKKGCCQKQCLEKIPMELLARSRIQMKGLSSDDRHMYILGKVSTSMSLVRPGIIASGKKVPFSVFEDYFYLQKKIFFSFQEFWIFYFFSSRFYLKGIFTII